MTKMKDNEFIGYLVFVDDIICHAIAQWAIHAERES